MMTVTINGKEQQVPEDTTVLGYLKEMGIDPLRVVAEVSGVIIDKKNYGGCILKERDVVEIIQFVGGG